MNYPAPPPGYDSTSSSKPPFAPDVNAATKPLLHQPPSNPIYAQPEPGDLPEDFNIGVNVYDSSPEIRAAFVGKVYTIVFCQILATTLAAGLLSHSTSAVFWVVQHPWSFYIPLFGSLIIAFLVYWKRHSYPLNFILLATYTLFEAFTLGIITAYVDNTIVLQALLITLGLFLGLTLFAFQSKYDFTNLGSWLSFGLLALIMTSLVGIFIPFNRTIDIIYCLIGCLVFSGYVLFDTQMITKHLSPDEYILASFQLYLDIINLFLYILRFLNDLNRD